MYVTPCSLHHPKRVIINGADPIVTSDGYRYAFVRTMSEGVSTLIGATGGT
jgi:hypothetical protein